MNRIENIFFFIMLLAVGLLNLHLAFNTPTSGILLDSTSFIAGLASIIYSFIMLKDALVPGDEHA